MRAWVLAVRSWAAETETARDRRPAPRCAIAGSARDNRGRAVSRFCRRPRPRRRPPIRPGWCSGRAPARRRAACGRRRRAARGTETPAGRVRAWARAGAPPYDAPPTAGTPQAKGEAAADGRAHQQRPGQPRAGGVGDAVDLVAGRGPGFVPAPPGSGAGPCGCGRARPVPAPRRRIRRAGRSGNRADGPAGPGRNRRRRPRCRRRRFRSRVRAWRRLYTGPAPPGQAPAGDGCTKPAGIYRIPAFPQPAPSGAYISR